MLGKIPVSGLLFFIAIFFVDMDVISFSFIVYEHH